jgi:hypothetical protein
MKKALTALATIAILAAPAALAQGKSYDVSSFSEIKVEGAMYVVHKTGNATSVRVEADNGDYSDAIIETNDDTLHISRASLNGKKSWLSTGRSVNISKDGKTIKVNGKKVPVYTVYVTSPELSAVKASQSSRFESQSINAEVFEAIASSSADIVLAGITGAASLSASSSGDVKAKNLKAATAKISASSSGDVEATVTGTGKTNVSASSSGDVTLHSTGAGVFTVSASSGASVDMSGACNSISVTASSGADVEAEELLCVSATANASSGADIDIFASSSASGNASSGGDISVRGNPSATEVSKSSGGSVKFGS